MTPSAGLSRQPTAVSTPTGLCDLRCRGVGLRTHVPAPPLELHQALAAARTAQDTTGYHADYACRAGFEGTMHQTASRGARRARYRGLPKTRLDHVYMACALDLLGLHAHWTGTSLDRQQSSHLARLERGLAA